MSRKLLLPIYFSLYVFLLGCSSVTPSRELTRFPTSTLTPIPTEVLFAEFTQTAIQKATNIVNTRVAANAHATARALTPTVTSVPPTPTVDFSLLKDSWKVYENTTYGFSFEYPTAYDQMPYKDQCGLKEDKNGIHIGQRSGLLIFDPQGLSIEKHTDGILSGKDWLIEAKKNTIVGGQPAITVEYRFGGLSRFGTFTLLENAGHIFAFDFTAGVFCDIPESEVYEFEAFHHMLDTFQFER